MVRRFCGGKELLIFQSNLRIRNVDGRRRRRERRKPEKLIEIKEKLKEKPVDALFCSYDVSFDAKGNTTYHSTANAYFGLRQEYNGWDACTNA